MTLSRTHVRRHAVRNHGVMTTPSPTLPPSPTITSVPGGVSIPSQTVDPTVVLYAPDPSAWSTDTTIALVGIVVALLGAVATGLLAWLALRQTTKATRLEREAQDRAGRLAAAAAIELYLAGWNPSWSVDGQKEIDHEAVRALKSSTAGVSTDAQSVASWVLDELDRTVDLFVEEHKSWDSHTASGVMAITINSAVNTIRQRVIAWVATGVMNRDNLYRPAPPPPFQATK